MSNLQQFNTFISKERVQTHLVQVLGDKKSSFVANLTSLVANDANLQACEPLTLMYAAISATALNLPLDKNLGYAYVIPYKNNRTGTSEAQFQLGAKGIVQLAMRSGQFSRLNVSDVRDGEMAGRNRLTGDITFEWCEDEKKRQTLPIIGFVAYFRLNNGFSKTLYMSVEEITAHASRYSQTFRSKNEYVRKSSKWTTDFEAMAEKTVLKRLLSKFAPLSVEMSTAFQADQSVQREQGAYTYVDNEQDETKQRLAAIAQRNAEAESDPEPEPEYVEPDYEAAEAEDDAIESTEDGVAEPTDDAELSMGELPFDE